MNSYGQYYNGFATDALWSTMANEALYYPANAQKFAAPEKPKESLEDFLDTFDLPEPNEAFLQDMASLVPDISDDVGAGRPLLAPFSPKLSPKMPSRDNSLPDFARAFLDECDFGDFEVPSVPTAEPSPRESQHAPTPTVPAAELSVPETAHHLVATVSAPVIEATPAEEGGPAIPLGLGQLPARLQFLTSEQLATRTRALERYREKKARRCFNKRIRYQSRKAYADVRPRYKGRFVSKEEYERLVAEDAARQSVKLGVFKSQGGTTKVTGTRGRGGRPRAAAQIVDVVVPEL